MSFSPPSHASAILQQSSPLCSTPPELLENIAVELVLSESPLGRPSLLMPFLCTCKHIYKILGPFNTHLYARLFKASFDVTAPRRRFGPKAVHNSALSDQYRYHHSALQDIRRADIYHEDIERIFRVAFLMLVENDGKNRAQLRAAGLESYVDKYVRTLLMDGKASSRGWPPENPINSLALWLMVMTMSQGPLLSETPRQREELIYLLLPYVFVCCRYPTAHAPPNHFRIPIRTEEDDFPYSSNIAHGLYPLYRIPEDNLIEAHIYGRQREISIPLASIAAKILFFARRQKQDFHIPNNLPFDRAQAFQAGIFHVSPTQMDMKELNMYKPTKLPMQTTFRWWEDMTEEQYKLEMGGNVGMESKTPSGMYDVDWQRWIHCIDPREPSPRRGIPHKLASLNGLFVGRMAVTSEGEYMRLINTQDHPGYFSEAAFHTLTSPLFMRLQEHHCVSPAVPLPPGGKNDGFDDGLLEGYLSSEWKISQGKDYILVTRGGQTYRYETCVPGRRSLHDSETCNMCGGGEDEGMEDREGDVCNGVRDIIITGTTDPVHGNAWNHYRFFGRIRPWDGLIVLIRESTLPHIGRWVFMGYLVGGQNLVGNWSKGSMTVEEPTWEGPFIASKRED